jgi:hypothetical protein
MSTLQKFCTDFKLPDLSPLIAEDLPVQDRCAVVWQVMQTRLSVKKQGEFLRGFCESSELPALASFAVFLTGGISANICNNAMDVVKKMTGVDAKLGDSMKEFCAANGLVGVAAFVDKFGLESVVYNIDSVFRVAGEPMHCALDSLKFEANPARFAEELDRLMEKRNAEFAAKMVSLNAKLRELQAEKDLLEQPISPVLVGGRRLRGA